MATASFHLCTWDGDNGDVTLEYDDVSLLATGIRYQNLSAQPAAVVVLQNNVPIHTYILPAGTAQTVQPISGLGVVLVPGPPGARHPILPPGDALTCRYPA